MPTKKEKGRQWDGRSRPSDDKYRENFNRILVNLSKMCGFYKKLKYLE